MNRICNSCTNQKELDGRAVCSLDSGHSIYARCKHNANLIDAFDQVEHNDHNLVAAANKILRLERENSTLRDTKIELESRLIKVARHD